MNVVDRFIYHWHCSKVNWLKTLLFNFMTMPFKQAIKLPVYLYGSVDFYFLKGRIQFAQSDIKRGMVKMGMNKEYLATDGNRSLIILKKGSVITFGGDCDISSGFLLRVEDNAELTLGRNVFLGARSKIVCVEKITIGEFTQLAYESQVIDSDFHYVYDTKEEKISKRERAVVLGAYNWFGNRTTILKGTITNNYTICSSCSLLNKDYTLLTENNTVLGGIPAKIISTNKKRIFDLEIEASLVKFYKNNLDPIPERLLNDIKKSF